MMPNRTTGRKTRLVSCSALAVVLLSGCSNHAPLASAGEPAVAGMSRQAQAEGGIAILEARVAKQPRSAEARVALAKAYLSSGRFQSASTTFNDAISLGESSASIGLGLALSYIGSGNNAAALAELARWREEIPAKDLGLAIALAGQPAQGVDMLSDAVRGGDATAKTRQNLAYAYALAGRWTEARVVASQDLPADQIDARLTEWGSRARPDQFRARVAELLGAPLSVDPGQPAALALGGAEQPARMAEADEPATHDLPSAELPPVLAEAETVEAVTAPKAETRQLAAVSSMLVSPSPVRPAARAVTATAAKYVSQPRVQPSSPVRGVASAIPASVRGSHLVQLGSFSTLDNAKRAQEIFKSRNPALKGHTMRIIEADVKGRHFYRVAFDGFEQGAAQSLCSGIRQRGGACFAYAGDSNLPGVLPGKAQNGAMLASR